VGVGWHAPTGTIDKLFDAHGNSLGFLRVLFATLVILDHAFPLGGFNRGVDPMWGWTNSQEDIGGMAVFGFFVVSGFLVTQSFDNSGSVPRFFWKRFLRVFPGFWVCLLVTVVVFAPITYLQQFGGLGGYLSGPGGPLSYLYHDWYLQMTQYDVDGLLRHVPFPQAFDGSLWTLVYEAKCYVGVAILGSVGVFKRWRFAAVGVSLLFWVAQLEGTLHPTRLGGLPLLGDIHMAQLAFMFSLGMLLYLYRDRVLISNSLAVVAVVVFLVGMRTGLYEGIGEAAFAYLCFWLAVRLPFYRFDRFGDFSYGIYIYAFPVQQLAAVYGAQRWGLAAYVVLSLGGTLVFAIPSWFLIEKRSLSLKAARLGPGFGHVRSTFRRHTPRSVPQRNSRGGGAPRTRT